MHVCLFVMCLFVFECMLMLMLECIKTKRLLGNSLINTNTKISDCQNSVILQLLNVDILPHFKALHLNANHNHNKYGIILKTIKLPLK